jgi:hypothetical protein
LLPPPPIVLERERERERDRGSERERERESLLLRHKAVAAVELAAVRVALERVREGAMMRACADFIRTRALSHFTMLPFVSTCPGLLHFIAIDRSKKAAVSPAVAPLHGQLSNHSLSSSLSQAACVRTLIQWSISEAQRAVTAGFLGLLVRRGGFQVSYRMWFEDLEGFELVVPPLPPSPSSSHPHLGSTSTGSTSPLSPSLSHPTFIDGLPIDWSSPLPFESTASEPERGDREAEENRYGSPFYDGIASTFFSPAAAARVRCFELIALYVGVLPPKVVAECDERLLRQIARR